MKELLKVSIIIPVHNSVNTLTRCIESILTQKYKNIECILIENGSDDNSAILCSNLAKKNKRIIFKSIDITGVSAARNVGLSIATGDIVGFCDADDFLEKGAIDLIVNEFIDSPKVAAVFGGFNIGIMGQDDRINKSYRGIKEQIITPTKALQFILINDSVMGSVWNKYYRSDFLKNIEFDKTLSFCEDMHFNAAVLNKISKEYCIKVISAPLYCYMQYLNSVTHDENLYFDKNGELKYIVALKKIESSCDLDLKAKSCLKMKIACFAIDFFNVAKMDRNKTYKLRNELKYTYKYLIRNLFKNDWNLNMKRAFKGIKYLMI